jgi:hypothetical protein
MIRRDSMKTRASLILTTLLCISTVMMADASTVMLEAGPFAIILDEYLESMKLGGMDLLNTFSFGSITSRELIKENYYNLKIGGVIAKGEYGSVSKYSTQIEVSQKPLGSMFLFTPEVAKEITVGKLRPVNTTLFTGRTENNLTPYFVNYTVDGIYCIVYNPNTDENSMTDYLKNFDVIPKTDLGKYNLSKLWSES